MNVKQALKQVAKNRGVPVEKIYEGIEDAITCAMKNNDPLVQQHLAEIDGNGRPNAEMLIEYLISKVQEH